MTTTDFVVLIAVAIVYVIAQYWDWKVNLSAENNREGDRNDE